MFKKLLSSIVFGVAISCSMATEKTKTEQFDDINETVHHKFFGDLPRIDYDPYIMWYKWHAEFEDSTIGCDFLRYCYTYRKIGGHLNIGDPRVYTIQDEEIYLNQIIFPDLNKIRVWFFGDVEDAIEEIAAGHKGEDLLSVLIAWYASNLSKPKITIISTLEKPFALSVGIEKTIEYHTLPYPEEYTLNYPPEIIILSDRYLPILTLRSDGSIEKKVPTQTEVLRHTLIQQKNLVLNEDFCCRILFRLALFGERHDWLLDFIERHPRLMKRFSDDVIRSIVKKAPGLLTVNFNTIKTRIPNLVKRMFQNWMEFWTTYGIITAGDIKNLAYDPLNSVSLSNNDDELMFYSFPLDYIDEIVLPYVMKSMYRKFVKLD